jgi:hypothetical protein
VATEKTTDVQARVMDGLANRYRREIGMAHGRPYRRAVRSFSADAGCSEQRAKDWLASIGVTEPPNGNGKKK